MNVPAEEVGNRHTVGVALVVHILVEEGIAAGIGVGKTF